MNPTSSISKPTYKTAHAPPEQVIGFHIKNPSSKIGENGVTDEERRYMASTFAKIVGNPAARSMKGDVSDAET
jgi:hypothetical protein